MAAALYGRDMAELQHFLQGRTTLTLAGLPALTRQQLKENRRSFKLRGPAENQPFPLTNAHSPLLFILFFPKRLQLF